MKLWMRAFGLEILGSTIGFAIGLAIMDLLGVITINW